MDVAYAGVHAGFLGEDADGLIDFEFTKLSDWDGRGRLSGGGRHWIGDLARCSADATPFPVMHELGQRLTGEPFDIWVRRYVIDTEDIAAGWRDPHGARCGAALNAPEQDDNLVNERGQTRQRACAG